MIRLCDNRDFDAIHAIINDAAQAYKGVIPADRWHEPYMSADQLRQEIAAGVVFWGHEETGRLAGVMGIQDVQDVTLIRHAYVRTTLRGRGIGGRLLAHLRSLARRPILIGTWAAATWAIAFYRKHGFHLVSPEEKDRLLKRYWSIPARQVETSVVLAEDRKECAMKPLAAVDNDQFARLCGVEITERAEGRAKARMRIGPQHLNGMGMVHGGAIFTLADLVFEAACNSHGYTSVAINVNISYLKAAKDGTLHAAGEEVSVEGKLGSCVVRVTDDAGDLVAMFQGLSYRKGPPGPASAAAKPPNPAI